VTNLMKRVYQHFAATLMAGLFFGPSALAEAASQDPFLACDQAAAHAEAEWHLPIGLLAAIGAVESGRGGLGSALPVAWPWSINVDGRGSTLHDKASAIATTHALRAEGQKYIDVGCFQVDLFYHPEAFATLEVAFDPDANARAAAQILTEAWLRLGSWETAIAVYHSASPIRGARYLRRVQMVWPWARTRSHFATDGNGAVSALALSEAAQNVRVINADNPHGLVPSDLPRVVGPGESTAALQWTDIPPQNLPSVLAPCARQWRVADFARSARQWVLPNANSSPAG
jgi:hypothetical protein